VYPARYNKCVFFGGRGWQNDAPLENVKVKGITVNGERPVLYWQPYSDPSNIPYGYPGMGVASGNGVLYVAANKNCSWENIDVQYGGAYLGKALVYCFNEVEGNVTFKNMRMMGAFEQGENGFLSAHGSKCSLTFENVESGFNGGDGGPPPSGGASLAHGFYITRHEKDAEGNFPLVTFRGCQFHNSFRGHLLKCRNPNLLVEGCYFMGAPPSALDDPAMPAGLLRNDKCDVSDASELDMPNGGTLVFRNNILTKSWTGHEQGLFLLNWGAESGVDYSGGETDISGSIEIYNNTFVAYTNVARTLNTGSANTPIPLGFPRYNPDDDGWNHIKNPVLVRDNVYAGFQSVGSGAPMWFEQTAQRLAIDQINLPGIDGGVPFSPKVSEGSVGQSGAGFPVYAQRAAYGMRTDTNKGAVGTLQANIAPTGYAAQPMMSAQSNMQGNLLTDGRGVQYPLQYEWPVSVTATTVNSGTTGDPITPPDDPEPTADPTVGISTTDAGIMNGKTATLSGTVNLQGDSTGTVTLALVSQTGAGTIAVSGSTSVSGGAWTRQFTVPRGLWKIVVTASANGKTVTATTGNIRVLGLVGNFTLPA
jgi:hypothetical protein